MDDDILAEERIDEHRKLYISSLSPRTVSDDVRSSLGGHRGYFVVEVDDRAIGGGLNVLAKAASLEAAFRLIDLWRTRAEPEPA